MLTPLNADQFEEKGNCIFPQFLSEDEVDGIIGEIMQLREKAEFKKAGIGRSDEFQVNTSERGDSIHWIHPENASSFTSIYLQKINELIIDLNRNFYLGIKGFESHHTIYPSGSFYKKHVDKHRSGSSRIVSFVLYLNKSWKSEHGGELRIYENGDSYLDVAPIAGTLAIFLSEKEHEVLTTYEPRMSITGWMLNEDPILNLR